MIGHERQLTLKIVILTMMLDELRTYIDIVQKVIMMKFYFSDIKKDFFKNLTLHRTS